MYKKQRIFFNIIEKMDQFCLIPFYLTQSFQHSDKTIVKISYVKSDHFLSKFATFNKLVQYNNFSKKISKINVFYTILDIKWPFIETNLKIAFF